MRREELRIRVLDLLGGTVIAGPDLRDRLAATGIELSPLAFLGLMAELEARGVVRGRYEPGDAEAFSSGRRYRANDGGGSAAAA